MLKERPASRRVVLVSTASTQPRHQRRARMLVDAGFAVRVYGLGRGLYPENEYGTGADVVDLGNLESGQYIGRLPLLLSTAISIKRFESSQEGQGSRPDILYAFGLDAALIASLAFGKSAPLVYEVGDIRNADPRKSVLSRAIFIVERRIVARAAALVVTAPSFVDGYYVTMYPGVQQKTVLIENKLPSHYATVAMRPKSISIRKPIRIGFVGSFRRMSQ